MNSTAPAATQPASLPPTGNKLFHFLTEMRRRRVCRAVTLYSVALWLVCQIVDVISPALELPDWTLKLVIVFGLLGLPVIMIMSWFFEITPDGLVADVPGDLPRTGSGSFRPKHIADRLIDGSLILAAFAIGVQLAIVTLGPEPPGPESASRKIAVLPFSASVGGEAASFAEGLAIEMRHALREQLGVTVIATSNPKQLEGSLQLAGAVSTSETLVRVAVTMTDFDTGEVLWSAAFQQPRSGSLTPSSEIASQIAAALPVSNDRAEPVRYANVAH